MSVKVSIVVLALVVLLQVAIGFAAGSSSTSPQGDQQEPALDLIDETSDADNISPTSDAKLPASSGNSVKASRKQPSFSTAKTTKRPESQTDEEDPQADEEGDFVQISTAEKVVDTKTCKCNDKQRAPSSAASIKWKSQKANNNKQSDAILELDSADGEANGDILAESGNNKQPAELDAGLETTEDEPVDNQRQQKTKKTKNKSERNRNKRDTGKTKNKKASKKHSNKTGGSKQQKKQKSAKTQKRK